MNQWDVYYMVLNIDFYILGRRVYWKRAILKKRSKFAHKVAKILTDKFWEEGISFYIDVAGFQHKYNPHDVAHSIETMAWWLKNEGLHHHCSAKGSHVGLGGI